MDTTLPGDAQVNPADIRAYISDMLSQLADLARGAGDGRLETGIRLLAVEAAASERPCGPAPLRTAAIKTGS